MLVHNCVLLLLISLLVIAEKAEEKTESTADTKTEKSETAENAKPGNDHSHGFGKDIDWVDWKQAISIAMDVDKPIFLLIHKTWCGACKLLKQSFETSAKKTELVELSEKFIMTNTEDDEEPEDDIYAPDGRYIPRLFFLNKEGKPLDVDNKDNYEKNAYYYPQVPDVIKAMKRALKLYSEGTPEKSEQEITPEASESEQKDTKKKQETPKKVKTEKQPSEKKAKDDGETKKTDKNKKEESVKNSEEKSKTKSDKKKKEEDAKAPGGCPHAAGAKAQAAKKEAAKKEKTDSKTGKTEEKEAKDTASTKTKDTKKSGSKQTKKSEL